MSTNHDLEPRCFKIIRIYYAGPKRTIKTNVTLTEARLHCSSPTTHRKGLYFDCYDYVTGCNPKGGDR